MELMTGWVKVENAAEHIGKRVFAIQNPIGSEVPFNQRLVSVERQADGRYSAKFSRRTLTLSGEALLFFHEER